MHKILLEGKRQWSKNEFYIENKMRKTSLLGRLNLLNMPTTYC